MWLSAICYSVDMAKRRPPMIGGLRDGAACAMRYVGLSDDWRIASFYASTELGAVPATFFEAI